MTYTTKKLQGMSDFEVNKALAEKLGAERARANPKCAVAVDVMDVSGVWLTKNYCNNPLGVMPLAFERKIGLAPNKDSWEAFTLADNFQVISRQYVDKSPLRAIACLFLMMED